MNIYKALEKIIIVKPFALGASLFSEDMEAELDSDEDIIIWELLKNISSLGVKITENTVKFYPMIVWEGKRTFSVEDITDDAYKILECIDFDKIPLNLRVRVADIIWSYKKNYQTAKIAEVSYFELFKLWFSRENWTGTLDIIKRAICISAQINDNEMYEKSCDYVFEQLVAIDGKDDGFLSLRLLNILVFHEYKDMQVYINIATKIVNYNYEDVFKVEQAYSIVEKCYSKLKKPIQVKNTNLSLADYYVQYADKIIRTSMQDVMKAEHYLKQAVLLYRNNGSVGKAEEAHRKLVSIQKEIPKLMDCFSTKIDVSGFHKTIDLNLENLSVEESIVRLIQMITLYKKEDIKNEVIEEYKNHPLSNLFEKNMKNDSGQTIFTLPPLDISHIEANEGLLDLHINQKIVKNGKIVGDVCIKYALYRIRKNHDIKKQNVEFLIKDNPIIPEGREQIFCSALYMILCGQYYEGIHILAPQVENLFRCIAKKVGGLTVTLESDGSSKEKVLSSIFDLPELIDCYDNDILYLFKALLNEQSGANIRNEIAHGIVSEVDASSGIFLYFAVAVMKLLALTSSRYYDILKNSKKLGKLVMSNKDAIKICKTSVPDSASS